MGSTLAPPAPAPEALALDDDPLARALLPPPDEPPAARAARERAEAAAKQRSDEIDYALHAEHAAARRRGRPVKLLLLGQSESGKSTTLKNFQLTYAPKAWAAEKHAWRAVIQLNLVRSITAVADAVARELDAAPEERDSDPELDDPDPDADAEPGRATPAPAPARQQQQPAPALPLTETHRALVAQLLPLRGVQRDLERRIGAGADEDTGAPPAPAPSSPAPEFRDITNAAPQPQQEFFVRSSGWKSAVARLRPRASLGGRPSSDAEAEDDASQAEIARACAAMQALWGDPAVRAVVRVRRVPLLDCAEHFLDDLGRVARAGYAPSDDDVVRARLRTLGVQEHPLVFEAGPDPGREWIIYDVGGSRSLRAQWPAYFDDVNAILFLAPISAFDERLAEDRRANRLDDSLALWKSVCAHRLLARTELVLFLNKCDLLERKLAAGVRFREYVKSYKGENEGVAVGRFLKQKFTDVCRHYSKEHRGLHVHFTSVIDTKATAKTLSAVQDGILRLHLRNLDLI
ncbi:G-alpha-domain-containing protein [Phellopilus nigrolimitatus]|nr:G-alpha-domain-containing protein [Phellopilus nigrolimitatus]